MAELLPRKLAAILYADVAGYSRLTGDDEDATYRFLREYLDLISDSIETHRGTVVNYAGDAVLATFEAVVDALTCGAEIQNELKARNSALPEDRRIQFRIGINLGDVIEDRGDVYGDGVNVAARLESLAEPGSICISGTVYDAVGANLPMSYEYMGEQKVKNIEKPVRAYHAKLGLETSSGPVASGQARQIPLRSGIIAIAAVGLIGAGILLWQRPWAPEVEPASIEKMAHALPDNPSLVVLPFENMSADAEQGYFADGMTDDLITDLSNLSGLFIISRNSSFTYKGKAVKVREVAEELGVQYVLEGSVRRSGDTIRINAQLIDAISGYHLWAKRYDGSLEDVFSLQDQVVNQIVDALAVNLSSDESGNINNIETEIPQAYDAFLQGWSHYLLHTPEDSAKAVSFFEQAIALDPGYSRAYAGLARVYWNMSNLGWEQVLGIEWEVGFERAKSNLAIALKQPTAEAYAVQAEMLALGGKQDEALSKIQLALAMAPNSANYVSKALILNSSGNAKEAERTVNKALRLDPAFVPVVQRTLGRALLHQERYEEAAESFERAVSHQPEHQYSYASLASIYGHLGRMEDAQKAIEKYNEIVAAWNYTPITVQEIGWWWDGDMFFYDKEYTERLRVGLRKAGVLEGAAPKTDEFDIYSLVTRSDKKYSVEGATTIDASAAKSLHERGVPFVDVRDAGSFSRRHIPGAINLDLNLDFLEENLLQVAGKDEEIVFHCWAEMCSWGAYASAKAVLWDFARVYYFAGGLPAWIAAEYPVEASD